MLGIPVREPLGNLYRDVIHPGSPIDANALRAAETGRSIEGVERVVDLADGTRLHLSTSTAILRDTEGRPVGAVEVLHDLTKQKRMEQELARLNTLAALGEMAATIAHEVRNPLAGIGGFAALLLRDLPEDDDPAETGREDHQRRRESQWDGHDTSQLLADRGGESRGRSPRRISGEAVEQFRHDNEDRLEPFAINSVGAGAACGGDTVSIDPMLSARWFSTCCSMRSRRAARTGQIDITCQRLARQRATRPVRRAAAAGS